MIRLTIEMNANASPEAIWRIISNVQNMPKYWYLHRDVKVLEKAGSYLRVLINLALPKPFSKEEALVRVSGQELMIIFNFIKGPLRGKHIIKVTNGNIVSTWAVNTSFPLLIFKSWIIKRLRDATINALTNLINDAVNLNHNRN
ncbi:MAG: SRPBCC family protein [Caldivirga sp.]|uniref:SRPBCC family protein n=1 Tax=Caldivirga sp. TaxID=2080243 RepID=UPI003D0F8B99